MAGRRPAFAGGGPWCVNPWPAGTKNGGATAQGVTASTVKVVAYLPNDQMQVNKSNINQTNGQPDALPDAMVDWQKAYQAIVAQYGTYQLWGRTPVIDSVIATGPDETSQRADTVAVIAKKPFIVFDMTATTTTGAAVFSSLVAAKKIVTVSASTDAQNSAQQSPYRWNYGADPSSGPPITAALIGKALTGKKAQWAGDNSLKSKTRAFGAVYPTTGFDSASFLKYLTQNGGKLTDKLAYDPANAQTRSEQIATGVTHFKAAGITSVVLFADPTVVTPLMAAASDQQYSPEWIFTGLGYQDYDVFGRINDQKQMAHAFGLASLGPAMIGAPTGLNTFLWYWGTSQGNTWGFASGLFEFLYNAMHYAGPTLTAQNIQKGLFAAPASTTAGVAIGLIGYGKTVGLPYDETALFGSGRGLVWWDPDTTGPSNATIQPEGKGVFQYLNNGVNVTYKDLASVKATPKYFDPKVSVVQRNAADFFPGGVVPTPLPCTGCPSSSKTS